jgi:hypothetical protein
MLSCSELLSLLSFESIGSSVHNGLNLQFVGWVGNEVWEIFSHLDLSQVELTIEIVPELDLVWLSSQLGQWNGGHTDGTQDLFGGQVGFIID